MTDEPNDALDGFAPDFPPEEHEARMKDALRRFAKLPHKTQKQLVEELHASGKVKPKPRKPKAGG